MCMTPIHHWVEIDRDQADEFQKKWLGLFRSDILLLEDNATPHSAMSMQNHIATLGWERLYHPPYSADLAPSDFHLYPDLKKNLAQRCFGSNAEIQQGVKRFFHMQSPEFFLRGFLKLIIRYDKCLNVLEAYVKE
ncbi:histone-lysine N-methyltransferase SETMAR [Trichonephila clavipes]|nr:histone-lysine N-methyltransferase SETMAR [Trichonephila clavipes]